MCNEKQARLPIAALKFASEIEGRDDSLPGARRGNDKVAPAIMDRSLRLQGIENALLKGMWLQIKENRG